MHITGPPIKRTRPNIIKKRLKNRAAMEQDINEELEPLFSKAKEENVEYDADDIIDDNAQDGDQIDNEHDDQNRIEYNSEGNIQEIPDIDEANEDDLEDY